MEIPLGLRFQPFDYDVVRFLFEFVTGRNNSVDDDGLIHEEDIFGYKEPWELIRSGPSEKMAYFLSRLKKKGKSKTGCRVERTVGKKVNGKRSGDWHGQDKGKPVFDKKGRFVMGYKRSFIYKNRTEPEQDRQWLLKEFSLPEAIIKKARAEYPIVEERKDFVLCRLEPKKEDEDDEKSKLEKGGNDLDVETTSSTLQVITPSPSPSPSPVETTLALADDINSYFVGVRVEETLALTDDDMNSYLAAGDGGHDDDNIISSYLNLATGDADDINSYLGGVPVPVRDTDINCSYLVDVPMETLIVPGETLAPAAGDTDRDLDHHISSGVPEEETLPEPSSSSNSFMDFLCNMEDVTRLIDLDFDA